MKLSAYIVKFDTGFAPNPFGAYCTLACCKPTIRRNAEQGDIIIGTGSVRLPTAGRLVFAMKVEDVVDYGAYWNGSKFAARKPSSETAITRCGDNISHCENGKWWVAPGAIHNEGHQAHDVSGKNALIATEFFYFGEAADDDDLEEA